MKLPFRHGDQGDHMERTRGQAMVEFALILPVLVLLLVLAIDFGRVFFGWVAVNNATRIAASDAAVHPEVWKNNLAPGKIVYRQSVIDDMQAINCSPVGGGAWTTANVPDPVFVNKVGTADAYELNDHAQVTMNCRFSFITPVVGAILGNGITIAASAEFPVRGGNVAGVPVAPAVPPSTTCPDGVVPNMLGMSVSGARLAWTGAGFSGTFSPASGQDTESVLTQVTSPVYAVGACAPVTTTVTVTTSPPAVCSGSDILVPNMIGLTVAGARTTWTSAGFTGTFTPATGNDADTVTGQNPSPNLCRPAATNLIVTYSTTVVPPTDCQVPQLVGLRASTTGPAAYAAAGFSGSVSATSPPNGNYVITSQSLVGGQMLPCTTDIVVFGN